MKQIPSLSLFSKLETTDTLLSLLPPWACLVQLAYLSFSQLMLSSSSSSSSSVSSGFQVSPYLLESAVALVLTWYLFSRLCRWFFGSRRGQLPYVEVNFLRLIAEPIVHTFVLSDVMSLIVALYAIKVSSSGRFFRLKSSDSSIQMTAQDATDSRYSYGWHRAEILAALVNGVFLLALCFSISLEALERFFSTPGNCSLLQG